jgi:hypothetical protein
MPRCKLTRSKVYRPRSENGVVLILNQQAANAIAGEFGTLNCVPCATPKTISSRTRSALGSSALAASALEFIPSAMGSGFSRGFDEDAVIVLGPGPGGGVSIVALHIQHLTTWGASSGSSR